MVGEINIVNFGRKFKTRPIMTSFLGFKFWYTLHLSSGGQASLWIKKIEEAFLDVLTASVWALSGFGPHISAKNVSKNLNS